MDRYEMQEIADATRDRLYRREVEFEDNLINDLMRAMKDGEIPSHPIQFGWEICGYCEGWGHSSRHLGVITPSNDWDEEDFADYMAGKYDRDCTSCGGSGKVRSICEDELVFCPATVKWLEETRQAFRDHQQEAWAERFC